MSDLKDSIIYKCNKLKLAMLIQRIAFSADTDNALAVLNESITFYKPIMESLMKKEIRSSD